MDRTSQAIAKAREKFLERQKRQNEQQRPKRPLYDPRADKNDKVPRPAPKPNTTKSNTARPTPGRVEPSKSNNKPDSTKINHPTANPQKPSGRGLDVELHPLLRPMAAHPVASNPLKNPRRNFDRTALNPYLDQNNIGKGTHKPRPFQVNPQGKYIAKGDELREKLQLQEEERKELAEKQAKGLLPDENIAEDLYKPSHGPVVEWWDKPYLRNGYGSELVLDNEQAPVSIYIQHPVPIPPPWEVHEIEEGRLHLTKKEMKRKRRNERLLRHKEQQDRIKLGLEPPPPPKIKLSNLMNVLTNEAIQDPTGIEMKVKQEMQERFEQHMKTNEERKLTKEQKHEKILQEHDKDLEKGYFTTVYRIDSLEDPQNFFKVDINAKQLNFVGIILRNPKFNLVVVESGEKNINFYKKLLTRRIKWDQGENPTKCQVVWEGQLKQLHFQKWSVMYSRNDTEALDVLLKFGCENYWREASAL